jgi:hypothetical protein
MGRVETDWGRAGWATWAGWAALHAQPKTAGLGQSMKPNPPRSPSGSHDPPRHLISPPNKLFWGAKKVGLEADYDKNRDKPTLSAPRIAQVGSPAQPDGF